LLSDMEILRRAYERENDTRDRRPPQLRSWEYFNIGASRDDIRRLLDEGMLIITIKTSNFTRYKLSDKGRNFVFATNMEQEFSRVPAYSVIEAMDLIVGFDDVKQAIAMSIGSQRQTHFLLEGPPASAKSLMLEAVRSVVPESFITFGSRTSAAGLSEVLFEHQPSILLMDEADKMRGDCYSVMLGLMERGEILETKSQKTRGIKLKTMVIAACNSSEKFPPEFVSRFALHVYFPVYSRDEFIDVCRGFLYRAEQCPEDLAEFIGQCVFDYGLGDVRKARGVWQLMTAPTTDEVHRVIQLMRKYSPDNHRHRRTKITPGIRLQGM